MQDVQESRHCGASCAASRRLLRSEVAIPAALVYSPTGSGTDRSRWKVRHVAWLCAAILSLSSVGTGCTAETQSESVGGPLSDGTVVGCTSVGPPCGLTIDFVPAVLEVGTYAITIETSAGVTSCNYIVEPVRHQTAEEAEQQDAMLSACASEGSCPQRCTGPEMVYPRNESLTVQGGSEIVSVLIENVETGAQSSKTFMPDYAAHPAQTADCHQCVVAMDSMPVPASTTSQNP